MEPDPLRCTSSTAREYLGRSADGSVPDLVARHGPAHRLAFGQHRQSGSTAVSEDSGWRRRTWRMPRRLRRAARNPLPHPSGRRPCARQAARLEGRGDRGGAGWVLAALAVLLGLVMFLHAQIPNAVGNLGSALGDVPALGRPCSSPCCSASAAAPLRYRADRPAAAGAGLAEPLRRPVHRQVRQGRRPHRRHAQRQRRQPGPGGHRPGAVRFGRGHRGAGGAGRRPGRHVREGAGGHVPVPLRRARSALWSKYPMTGHRARRHQDGLDRVRCGRRSRHPRARSPSTSPICRRCGVKFDAGLHRRPARRQRGRAGRGHRGRPRGQGRPARRPERHDERPRARTPVTSQMRSTQGAAGDGSGFSWPASFPMARIDQIMVQGRGAGLVLVAARDGQRPPSDGRGARLLRLTRRPRLLRRPEGATEGTTHGSLRLCRGGPLLCRVVNHVLYGQLLPS